MKLEFGNGNINVMSYGDGNVQYGVAFRIMPERHKINETEPEAVIGRTLEDVKPDLQMDFTKSESAQVVIDKLVIVRDSLRSVEVGTFSEWKNDQPEFDADGYPTDLTLATIKNWPYGYGFIDLMEYVSRAWHWEQLISRDEIMDALGNDMWEYTLVTMGWSGNEDIIRALEGNYLFSSLCWRESHRGGKHIFEVKAVNNDKNQ